MKTKSTKIKQIPFPQFLEQLFNEAKPVHIAELYRLSDMDQTHFEQFQEQWPTASESRRQIIARHLADISEENSVVEFSLLFSYLLNDLSPAVRLAALDGLWDSDNLAIIDPIIQLLMADPQPNIQAAAASALGHFVLMGVWGQIPAKVKDRVVNALLSKYDQAELQPEVRRPVLESLSGTTHPRLPTLIDQAYDSDDEQLQISAVYAMGQSADKSWLPTILQEMSSPWPDMRAEAAKAAGNMGSSDALERLADLIYDEDLEVRLAGVAALGQIGGDNGYNLLRQLADDPEAEELYEAVEEALEEMELLNGAVDLTLMEWDEDEREQ